MRSTCVACLSTISLVAISAQEQQRPRTASNFGALHAAKLFGTRFESRIRER